MKGLKTVTAALLCLALLTSIAAAATSKPPRHAVFRHYVACGLSQNAKPSHVCRGGRVKAAFFRSNYADVHYTVCLRFPTGAHECKPYQEAEKGILYFNKISSNIPGLHEVSWFVKGRRVGVFPFRVVGKGARRKHQ
jgi:hypothetical protein